jgi:hypothetical protein
MNKSNAFIFSIVTTIIAISIVVNGYSQQLSGIVDKASELIVEENFRNLSKLYLLPTTYSLNEIIEERKGLEESLDLLSDEFGHIDDLQVNREEVRWLNLEIFGGDVSFIKSNSNFLQYVFQAKFSKLGDGFIIIRTYPNNGKEMIRSVGYALPNTPDSAIIIKEISGKLIELMFPEQVTEKI